MAGALHGTAVGHLGKDPETRYLPSGAMNVSFSIGVSRKRGETEQTTWVKVTCWGKLAEIADGLAQSGALVKGKQVYAAGDLSLTEYTGRDGVLRFSLEMRANDLQLLGKRGDDAPAGERPRRQADAAPIDYDEPPF
jgi:single-strand DNA-binding protein